MKLKKNVCPSSVCVLNVGDVDVVVVNILPMKTKLN